MACPFFDPVERHSRVTDVRDAMLPLGDAWAGVCRAVQDTPATPDDAALRPLCNLGYARGNCPRFPVADGPDAVRFTIARDSGDSIGIYYVVERDHHPFAHGLLEYTASTRAINGSSDALLTRQAAAYAESFRRRKNT